MAAGEEICGKVARVLVEALNMDEEDIKPTATLQGDLGAESIDFLDIVFRLEREFGIKIPRGELFPESFFQGDPDFVHNNRVTDRGLAELRLRMSFVDLRSLERDRQLSNVPGLFTVQLVTSYISWKLGGDAGADQNGPARLAPCREVGEKPIMARRSLMAVVIALGLTFTHVQGAEPAPVPSNVARLMRNRLEAAQKTFKQVWDSQGGDPERAYRWSCRWLEAERALSEKTGDRIAALRAHRERMREIEQVTKRQFHQGFTSLLQVRASEFYVAEAEVWMSQTMDQGEDPEAIRGQ